MEKNPRWEQCIPITFYSVENSSDLPESMRISVINGLQQQGYDVSKKNEKRLFAHEQVVLYKDRNTGAVVGFWGASVLSQFDLTHTPESDRTKQCCYVNFFLPEHDTDVLKEQRRLAIEKFARLREVDKLFNLLSDLE